MNNLDKNQDKRLQNLKPIPFTKDNQPTPEAKSKGWEKRRAKQEIMDLMTRLRNMSVKEFDDLKEDVKKNPDKHTVLETKLMQYITKERFTIDFLDRNVGRPQQDIDVTSDGKGIQKYIFEIVNKKGGKNGQGELENGGLENSELENNELNKENE